MLTQSHQEIWYAEILSSHVQLLFDNLHLERYFNRYRHIPRRSAADRQKQSDHYCDLVESLPAGHAAGFGGWLIKFKRQTLGIFKTLNACQLPRP